MTGSPFPWQLVTVDIDGTLTVGHGWRAIAEAFGRRDEFDATNRRFRDGTIGEDLHLADLLSIARDRTPAELEAAIAGTPHLAGIAAGVAELHRRGARAALLSHNPGIVIEYYRRTYGFDDGEGVADPPLRDGRFAVPGTVHADKPAGLIALLARAGAPARAAVHVGDGPADARLFPLVGGGVALNSAYPEVERAADLAIRATDFRTVVARLAGLSPRA